MGPCWPRVNFVSLAPLHFADATYRIAPVALDAQTVMLEGVALTATTPPAINATDAEIKAGNPNFRRFDEIDEYFRIIQAPLKQTTI
ncbi:MAG: hypothetical protein EBV75_02155 [Acidimicrobiia bacterium]|nr:hypothetical protein [Acidimicrobiia bacterium]